MSYDSQEAARLISWSNKQAGIGPLSEAELVQWIDEGVAGLEWEDVWGEDGEVQKYIDFPTLISLRMICLLHFELLDSSPPYSLGIPLKVITDSTPKLKRDLRIEWPFASKAKWDLHNKLPIASSDKVEAASAVDLKADWDYMYWQLWQERNCGRRRVAPDLEFAANGLACAWLPVKDVVIDARVVSGSPCVVGTRTPTWVFTGMLKGGDRIEELAIGYRLTKEQVWNALDWERQLDAAGV